MRCPKCGAQDQKVPDTNSSDDQKTIRRRICKECGHAFFTVEVIVPDDSITWRRTVMKNSDRKKSAPILKEETNVWVGVNRNH